MTVLLIISYLWMESIIVKEYQRWESQQRLKDKYLIRKVDEISESLNDYIERIKLK